jgi:hypothetical protein
MYVLGGSTVILSALSTIFYREEFIDLVKAEYPVPIYLFFLGISYVIGYGILEAMRLIGLVPSIFWKEPSERGLSLFKNLYRKFFGEVWKDVTVNNPYRLAIDIYDKSGDRSYISLQRIISMKHIGSTMGSSFLVSGLILLITGCPLSIILLVSSAVLLFIGWLKAAHQIKYMVALNEANQKDKGNPGILERFFGG